MEFEEEKLVPESITPCNKTTELNKRKLNTGNDVKLDSKKLRKPTGR